MTGKRKIGLKLKTPDIAKAKKPLVSLKLKSTGANSQKPRINLKIKPDRPGARKPKIRLK
jgi:hypothetical protein